MAAASKELVPLGEILFLKSQTLNIATVLVNLVLLGFHELCYTLLIFYLQKDLQTTQGHSTELQDQKCLVYPDLDHRLIRLE